MLRIAFGMFAYNYFRYLEVRKLWEYWYFTQYGGNFADAAPARAGMGITVEIASIYTVGSMPRPAAEPRTGAVANSAISRKVYICNCRR
jgi:hypothetical protein